MYHDGLLFKSDCIALATSLQQYGKPQPLRDVNQPANNYAPPKPPPLPDDQQLSLQGKDEEDVRQQPQCSSAEHNHSRSSADNYKDYQLRPVMDVHTRFQTVWTCEHVVYM